MTVATHRRKLLARAIAVSGMLLVACVSKQGTPRTSVLKIADFPVPLEGGNDGDGSPLVLGDSESIGDLYLSPIHVVDWDGDGEKELVGAGMWGGVFSFGLDGSLPDGTPIVERGRRWGRAARIPGREDQDTGLCGKILATGDFDGDGRAEVILAPRHYAKAATVVLVPADGTPRHRDQGLPLRIIDPALAEDTEPFQKWRRAQWAPLDWDRNGRLDLVAALESSEGYSPIQPDTKRVPEDQRDRYTHRGQWKGKDTVWSLHLFSNTGEKGRPEFTYAGAIELESPPPGGPLAAVNPQDPGAGLVLLGYYGDLWHLPLLEPGERPTWGELTELFSVQGAPFTRSANMLSITVSNFDDPERFDILAGDVAYNVLWCRSYGKDKDGRPVFGDPKKIKQRNPHVNGGYFSVVTVGDWRGTGIPDLLVGGIEGYIFWYKTLSTNPLRFAPPERVRLGDEEIRRFAKPNPAAGYYWGSSQGPGDGFNGGYSNPVLVDWDDDGLLDLIVSDMIGLYDCFPNRGTRAQPALSFPCRLHVEGEQLFGPWRVQPGAGDFTGDGLPDLITMDLDLDLVLYRRAGGKDPWALLPGEKLTYQDGSTIKTHGVYTAAGGDGRGRTKIQVVDWNHDGELDLLLGVGPQSGSPFSSYVLLCLNAGSNAQPVFKRPEVLLFDSAGEPLEFWRHAAHPAAVDWDQDGKLELLVGADQGFVWYFKPEHFGEPAVSRAPPPRE